MSSLEMEIKRATAIRYAWSMLGLPYIWGGDDPIIGFDCSGFVIEVLTAVGLLPHKYDDVAQGLLDKWRSRKVEKPSAGCLLFWFGSDGVASHVEMAIDEWHTIGASGGGSATTSDEAAAASNAFIKIRPFGYRGKPFVAVDPFRGGST